MPASRLVLLLAVCAPTAAFNPRGPRIAARGPAALSGATPKVDVGGFFEELLPDRRSKAATPPSAAAVATRRGSSGGATATPKVDIGAFMDQAFARSKGPSAEETARVKQELLALCASIPDNGVGASADTQARVEELAQKLARSCPRAPATVPLEGVYDLLYCTSAGGSSGKLGPFVGAVSQTFVDEVNYINAVELGPLRVQILATREPVDAAKLRVRFSDLTFSLFGNEVARKQSKGSGVWDTIYIDDDLRVMYTPSLFVLRKRA